MFVSRSNLFVFLYESSSRLDPRIYPSCVLAKSCLLKSLNWFEIRVPSVRPQRLFFFFSISLTVSSKTLAMLSFSPKLTSQSSSESRVIFKSSSFEDFLLLKVFRALARTEC
jgi:hypothetical protein